MWCGSDGVRPQITRLRGHELQMLAVALAHGLADDTDRLFASIDFE
jgi:hypothetical protein